MSFSVSGSYVPSEEKSGSSSVVSCWLSPPSFSSSLSSQFSSTMLAGGSTSRATCKQQCKERNELNTYINLVILLKRQVQIQRLPALFSLACFFSFFTSSLLLRSFIFAVISWFFSTRFLLASLSQSEHSDPTGGVAVDCSSFCICIIDWLFFKTSNYYFITGFANNYRKIKSCIFWVSNVQ